MQERHLNRKKYFEEQILTTEKYVIPYIEKVMKINENTRVLEIGCGEGGNMVPFLERGCPTVGIDLNEEQLKRAGGFIDDHLPNSGVKLMYADIYEVDPESVGRFDLIIMRDVIEHIPNQEKFLHFVKAFLHDNGCIFFGFPPWRMPFGGHQQVCKSALSKLPYIHLLPKPIFKWILEVSGEQEQTIESLLFNVETGIGIDRFERIIRHHQFKTERKTLYFINPNYEIKFGLKPRVLSGLISWIPWFRDFITTCYYGLVRKTD